MQLGQILRPDFQAKLKELMDKPLTMKVARKLKKTVDTVTKELAEYEELRISAIKKYAKLDKSGKVVEKDGQVVFKKGGMDSFLKEHEEIIKEKIKLEKIKISDLGDIEMSVNDMIILEPILED
jgi:translation initiation factor 2 alpha subunit (eIF-2alpha)